MSKTSPPEPQTYVGPITDTRRWQNFKPRPDDIFICTPPKCGTTWTQAICAMLVFGEADHGQQPGIVSPWLDAQFVPVEENLAQLEAQTHRRFIKTHSPFDGVPYYPECTYLAVFRDPRDAYCSGLNHRDNMTDKDLAYSAFPHGPNAFRDWLSRVREPGSWDLQSLDSMAHMLQSYWAYRDLPNLHLFHYSDMKRDLKGSIAAMAAALGYDYDDATLAGFARAAEFSSMKRKAEQFAPNSGTGMWKAEADFFANGGNEQWRVTLNGEDLQAFDERIAELLSEEEIDWILNGND